MPEEIVYALHNFVAENEDEIPFSPGEPIVVLEKDEKYMDGWWQGRNARGQVGLFPMNYTTPIKPSHLQHSPTLNSSYSTPLSSNSSSSSASRTNLSPPRPSSYNTLEDQINNTISEVMPDARATAPKSSRQMTATVTQLQYPPPGSPPPPPPPLISPSTSSRHLSGKPEDWTIEQVTDWLQSVGLDNVTQTFIEQEITGDILVNLTMDSLKELGITAYGRRYKIMNAIQKLKPPIEEAKLELSVSSHISSARGMHADHDTSAPTSPLEAESMYQFPRKAPLPPLAGGNSGQRRPTDSFTNAPLSPRSFGFPSVSRSNTFQTMSSKISSSSSSIGTGRSRDRSPDPKGTLGMFPPHRMPSQKSSGSEAETTTRTSTLDTPPMSTSGSILHERTSIEVHPVDSIQHKNNYNDPPVVDPTDSLVKRDRNMSVASVDQFGLNGAGNNAFQTPEHEGWLHKQGDRYKTWNKRWFVLKGPNLFYFKSPKDVKMKGIIHLRGYRIIVDETIHAGKYSFKAQHERERTFYFYTDTHESMRTWINVLMKATITRDMDAPVMSSNHVATVPLEVARRMRPRPPSVIMYNNKSPQTPAQKNAANDKMTMVQEEREEETREHENITQQERESGITFPQSDSSLRVPDVTDKYTFDLESTAPAPTLSSSIVMHEEDEDLIDPHHRGVVSPPLEHSLMVSSQHVSSSDQSSRSSSSGSVHEASTRSWTRAQYIDWINQYLPPGKRVIDLKGAFRNGDTLILLLEALSHKTVRRPPAQKGGSVSMAMLDNIVAAFKFMGREGVVVDGRYTIKDVFGGNESKIMDMLDALRTWAEENGYQLKETSAEETIHS